MKENFWQEVSKNHYLEIFSNSPSVFHSTEFSELNCKKVDEVIYLIAKINKCNYGIVFGKSLGILKSPFSSPFGGIIYSGELNLLDLSLICKDLILWAKSKLTSLNITFPPTFYNPSFLSSIVESFEKVGFETNYIDINSHFDLRAVQVYEEKLERNARKNLNNALKHNHVFSIAKTVEEEKHVYSIIQKNRLDRGYPLRMSFEDIKRTNSIVPIDFFLLKMKGVDCAAAIVFSISDNNVMVVYWGSLKESLHLRPMNLLPKLIFLHYQQLGKQFIDIGPSSEFGIINEGLASFKKSLGCISTLKHSFKFTYD